MRLPRRAIAKKEMKHAHRRFPLVSIGGHHTRPTGAEIFLAGGRPSLDAMWYSDRDATTPSPESAGARMAPELKAEAG